MSYSVGIWDYSRPVSTFVHFGRFSDCRLAVRTARRLYQSILRRGDYESISVIRYGGGTVFELDYSFPRMDRRIYMRLLQQEI